MAGLGDRKLVQVQGLKGRPWSQQLRNVIRSLCIKNSASQSKTVQINCKTERDVGMTEAVKSGPGGGFCLKTWQRRFEAPEGV